MKGFTLIELIIVMILISIVSTVGIGMLSGTQAYDARLVADQWLTGLRLGQKLALLRQDASQLLTFTATQGSSEWDLTLAQGGSELNSITLERHNVVLRTSTTDFAGSCASLPQASFPLVFYLNGYGDRVDASRVQANSNVRLCFVASQAIELCISPSGYAYGGSCQP